MGMYTEIYFSANLKDNLPQEVQAVIAYMATANAEISVILDSLPAHSLFQSERWKWLMVGHSYYFNGSSFRVFRRDKIGNFWALTFKADIKNYQDEIGKWLDFITPYLEPSYGPEHIGHFRYEEQNAPTLLYQMDGKIMRVETKSPEIKGEKE